MRKTSSLFGRHSLKQIEAGKTPPIIQLDNATFYRQYPSSTVEPDPTNPPIFPRTTFVLPSSILTRQYWAVIGPSNAGKTTFLEILRGQHVCIPPTARSYPYLSDPNTVLRNHASRSPSAAIHYVGFGEQGGVLGSLGVKGAYISARYESRKEESDFSVMDYLKGNTELNPYEDVHKDEASQDLTEVIEELRLDKLIDMPVGNLSNGQTRRARIAKALLCKPEILLLDEPFMGLDPSTQAMLSSLLFKLAEARSPRLVISLRPQDPVPSWITHVVYLNPKLQIAAQGSKGMVLREAPKTKAPQSTKTPSTIGSTQFGETDLSEQAKLEEPVVEMKNVVIKYGDREILGCCDARLGTGLDWTVRKGQRWGVFGPNGSGKTTLISLICSDHPLAYSLQIKMFGRGRLPQLGQPGISIFDIQARIGHSSPEVHAFFPRSLTVRQTIENAWAETFLGTPHLTSERSEIVNAVLLWFQDELNPNSKPRDFDGKIDPLLGAEDPRSTSWADSLRFRDVSVSSQRVMLFLRAVVKKPELLILDEAFAGMDAEVRDKCMLFLIEGTGRYYQKFHLEGRRKWKILRIGPFEEVHKIKISGLTKEQALVCVSHVKEEVPDAVREWMCLPEAGEGKPVRFGRFDQPLRKAGWDAIWGGM